MNGSQRRVLTKHGPLEEGMAKPHAAAAAKSLQSCPTPCNPTDSSPLLYYCLRNPMDREAWWASVRVDQHRVGHNYFGHLMQRVDSLKKTLMLGQEEKGTTEDEMAGWHH